MGFLVQSNKENPAYSSWLNVQSNKAIFSEKTYSILGMRRLLVLKYLKILQNFALKIENKLIS